MSAAHLRTFGRSLSVALLAVLLVDCGPPKACPPRETETEAQVQDLPFLFPQCASF